MLFLLLHVVSIKTLLIVVFLLLFVARIDTIPQSSIPIVYIVSKDMEKESIRVWITQKGEIIIKKINSLDERHIKAF